MIFGREPAALVGVLEGLLAFLFSIHVLAYAGVDTQPEFALLMAVVTTAFGVYTAWATDETLLGAVVGFAKAVLAFAAIYGLRLDDAQTGALVALITVVLGLWHRGKTSPLASPTFRSRPVAA